jgi:hypothetical protein
MIRIEDLSEKRQKDLIDTIKYNEPWKSDALSFQHMIGTLQQDKIEKWEQYGFGALKTQKWLYQNGVKYYLAHKDEIDQYTIEHKGNNEPLLGKKPSKEDQKQEKERQKQEEHIHKMLYGAGDNGWTVEWFNRIYQAYKDNTLTITGESVFVNTLLSIENLKEGDLTDVERLGLMMFAHPQRVITLAKNDTSTVLSPIWHKTTNFREIKSVVDNYPSIYAKWCKEGVIPTRVIAQYSPINKEIK